MSMKTEEITTERVPSQWIQKGDPVVEVYRRSSWLAIIRSKLPKWLGGRPLFISSQGRSAGALTSFTSDSLSLKEQHLNASSTGRAKEAARVLKKILEHEEVRSKISRVK